MPLAATKCAHVCAVCATFAALSYPILGVSAVTSISESFIVIDNVAIHFNAMHAVFDKRITNPPAVPTECR